MLLIAIIGIILNIMGIIGCIFPAMPGIPFNYAALILLNFAKGGNEFSPRFLIVYGLLSVLVLLFDYVLPLIGAKKFGASRQGIWGAIVGMIIGIFFLPPFGIILGLLLGAFVGELLAGKEQADALRAGLATFLGSLTSLLVKLALALVMSIHFLIHLF